MIMVLEASETTQLLNERRQIMQEKVIELASFSLGRDLGASAMDQLLYGTDTGFDSIALMEFVLRLEDEFGIGIPDEDLDPDVFGSISTIVAYVHRRLDEVASSPRV